uniref:Uncharacterized protein n=1 Tax=Glossina palpalis gambiensis TaxID=67801 RepID=A0A1B0AWH2_9MUSC
MTVTLIVCLSRAKTEHALCTQPLTKKQSNQPTDKGYLYSSALVELTKVILWQIDFIDGFEERTEKQRRREEQEVGKFGYLSEIFVSIVGPLPPFTLGATSSGTI